MNTPSSDIKESQMTTDQTTQSFAVTGMTCGHCAGAVTSGERPVTKYSTRVPGCRRPRRGRRLPARLTRARHPTRYDHS